MHKILIVDDEEINRIVLTTGLSDMFEIVQAEDGRQALDCLYADMMIEALLLDLNMPEMNGFEVMKDMKETGLMDKIPVFVVTAADNEEDLLQSYELGAVDVVSKPFNLNFLKRKLSNLIELYAQRNDLSVAVEDKSRKMIKQSNRLVEAIANIVEFRSNESGSHVRRVSSFTKLLMEGIIYTYPEYTYLYDDVKTIAFAASLHDLGKIAIPDVILGKPGKLTPEEFEIMKSHTIHGYTQVTTLKDIMDPKLYEYSLDIARHHHEKYNGRGYPDHLKGDEITIWSQAAGLADAYDALTSDRCYKKAYTHEVACNMILNGECGMFNPKIIEVFKSVMGRFNELRLGIRRKKILIVDDSPIDRTTLRTILSNKYDVMEMESGIYACSHLKAKPEEYDAIITDVYMPNMDGFDMLRRLGKELTTRIPVIMCSVEVNKDVVKRAAMFGVKSFLRKPFDIDLVLKKVEEVTSVR